MTKDSLHALVAPTKWKRRSFYIVGDVVVVLVASLLTYAVAAGRDGSAVVRFATFVLPYVGIGLACQVGLGFLLSTYDLRWSTFSLAEVPRAAAPAAATAALLGFLTGFGWFSTLTPWTALTWGLLNVCGVIAVRGSNRFYDEMTRRKTGKRAILVVSTDKAYFLLDTLRRIPHLDYRFIGFVDPAPRNQGTVSQGLPVLGDYEEIERIVARHRVDAAFVFLSSSPTHPQGGVYQQLRALGVEVRLIPSLADVVDNRGDAGLLERLALHELTGRPPVVADPCEMRRFFGGKRILITGAGGSIGSELCRQLARFDPERLVLFERDDSNLFGIERELLSDYPKLDILPFLGDIARESDVDQVFRKVRPLIVFHAAAYKHVPILEFHACEAARVNVLGSHAVARAAVKYGTECFVYVSTDKAVNPTNVMGASKRLGEMVVTSMNGLGDVRFLAVRFGNVLSSRGSVSTIFSEAIARRRPIDITHPDMERYFMLTSEAVLLVMQAATLGGGGEVFVLDMGKPVRIRDLAAAMIRHAGLRPDIDIPIFVTGRRPGEKLFEELLTAEEGTVATTNDRIRRARISRHHCYPELADGLSRLAAAVRTQDPGIVRAELTNQVGTYRPDPGSPDGRPTASGSARRSAVEVMRSRVLEDSVARIQTFEGSGEELFLPGILDPDGQEPRTEENLKRTAVAD